MVTIWLPAGNGKGRDQTFIRLRYKIQPEPRPFLTLQPVRISDDPDWNPLWEDWHCYLVPLTIDIADYQRLLAGYFEQIFPTRDAFDGRPLNSLDFCSDSWLGAKDWRTILAAIQKDMGEMSRRKRNFYDTFLRWVEAALTHTDIIIVDGNQ